MAYTKEDWKKRIAERNDMSTSLIHLTKGNSLLSTIDVLYNILKDKKSKREYNKSWIYCW